MTIGQLYTNIWQAVTTACNVSWDYFWYIRKCPVNNIEVERPLLKWRELRTEFLPVLPSPPNNTDCLCCNRSSSLLASDPPYRWRYAGTPHSITNSLGIGGDTLACPTTSPTASVSVEIRWHAPQQHQQPPLSLKNEEWIIILDCSNVCH